MTVADYNLAVDAHSDGIYRFALKHLRDTDLREFLAPFPAPGL